MLLRNSAYAIEEYCLDNEIMINKTISFAVYSTVVCKPFPLVSNVKYSLNST